MENQEANAAERTSDARTALNFVTDGTLDRIVAQRSHREEVLRECFRHSVERIHKDNETMVDYCRALILAKLDATKELNDAETLINAELLVIKLLQREHSGGE